MHISLLDPFHGGSHAAVAEGFAQHSRNEVALLTLPIDGGWRWRMRGGAVTLARMYVERDQLPDLIVTTDMLDLATFRGLLHHPFRASYLPPIAVYFHENQLTYPLPPGRTRDLSFAWINYTSALTANAVFFNSEFHRRSFLEALPSLLGRFHDYQERDTIAIIAAKTHVLTPGIDLRRLDENDRQSHTSDHRPPTIDHQPPIILWNSRWEYDKQPGVFFNALEELASRGVAFQMIIAGEHIDPNASEFLAARERWADRIIHWGYAPDLESYRRLLWQADIVVSTALQEFFGISLIEALFCGCVPVLPRRLSYPDLLPNEHHAVCLYNTPAELVDRLHSVILNVAALRERNWRAIAASYDWSLQAPVYDAAFEGIMTTNDERRKMNA